MDGYVSLDLSLPDRRHKGAVTQGLVRQLRDRVRTEILRPGDRLPPSRHLAQELGIARGSVTTAYDILISEELLIARPGAGVFVATPPISCPTQPEQEVASFPLSLPPIPAPDIDPIVRGGIDFRPCRPSVSSFPLQVWRKCLARAGSRPLSPDYGDACGAMDLRRAIADYLHRARGLDVEPEAIFITSGILHGMSLLSALFLREGSKVAVEDPGYPLARQIFTERGATLIPCPVDRDGLIVEKLPRQCGQLRFLYVTPSHQFPEGTRLSAARRHALVQWAQENEVVLLEDDYDGEYRYDVPPLPPLAAIPNGCTVYLGTFSKTLFPDIRIGFAVAPPPLIQALGRFRALQDYAPSTVMQNALTDFIREGHFEKHILRMRRTYRTKRQAVLTAVRDSGMPAALTGLESGLHAMISLEDGGDAMALTARAAGEGILIPTLDRYRLHPTGVSDKLILGYAEPTRDAIAQGVATLARLYRG